MRHNEGQGGLGYFLGWVVSELWVLGDASLASGESV